MPLPQVNDRIKEIPAQTLRAVFAGIGQMLLIADKLRARAAEQISSAGAAHATKPADAAGTGAVPATEPADAARPADAASAAAAARPADEAPSRPPQAPDKPARATRAKGGARPAPPQRPRWRSLDETGNVRLLGEGDEELASEAGVTTGTDTAPAAAPAEPTPAASAASPPPAATSAPPASSAPAPPPAPTQPAPATSATAASTSSADAAALPLANYDQLSLASLRARLRVLDAAQVSLLLDYEKAHESRPDVVTMFERRIAKLNEGS
jgi:hypothetical protein